MHRLGAALDSAPVVLNLQAPPADVVVKHYQIFHVGAARLFGP
jgi:hypothetical protein